MQTPKKVPYLLDPCQAVRGKIRTCILQGIMWYASCSGSCQVHVQLDVLLCMVDWLLITIACLISACTWHSGWSPSRFWPYMENVSFLMASAFSGEGLSKSPALMLFGTLSIRDSMIIRVHANLAALLTHSPVHLFTHSPVHPFAHLPVHPFAYTHLPICPFACSPVHPFAHSSFPCCSHTVHM